MFKKPLLEGPADPKRFRKIILYRWCSVMVSIALLLFRPNTDFVLLLPVVEPVTSILYICEIMSHVGTKNAENQTFSVIKERSSGPRLCFHLHLIGGIPMERSSWN